MQIRCELFRPQSAAVSAEKQPQILRLAALAQNDTTNNLNGIRIARECHFIRKSPKASRAAQQGTHSCDCWWRVPQGLKPWWFLGLAARLKSCPFTRPVLMTQPIISVGSESLADIRNSREASWAAQQDKHSCDCGVSLRG
jgi:hypothetical protein